MGVGWWVMDDGWWVLGDGWTVNGEWWILNGECKNSWFDNFIGEIGDWVLGVGWWMMDDGWWTKLLIIEMVRSFSENAWFFDCWMRHDLIAISSFSVSLFRDWKLNIKNSPFTIKNSSFTIKNSQFTNEGFTDWVIAYQFINGLKIHHSPFTIKNSQFTIENFIVKNLPLKDSRIELFLSNLLTY